MPLSINSLRMKMARCRALTLCVALLIVMGKVAPVLAMPVNHAAQNVGSWEAHCAMPMSADMQMSESVHDTASLPAGLGAHACCGDNAHLCDVHCAPLLSSAQSTPMASPLSLKPFPAALIAPALRALEPPRRPPRV